MQDTMSGQHVGPRLSRAAIGLLAAALLAAGLASCDNLAAAPARATQPVVVDTDMASDDAFLRGSRSPR